MNRMTAMIEEYKLKHAQDLIIKLKYAWKHHLIKKKKREVERKKAEKAAKA